jgi:hypothetical protein
LLFLGPVVTSAGPSRFGRVATSYRYVSLSHLPETNSRFAYFEPTKGKLTHHFGGKMNSFLADSRENTPPSAHMNTAVNSHGIGFAKLSCLSISMVVLSDEKMHQIP